MLRMLGFFIACCLGFLLMMGTVGLVASLSVDLFDMSHTDDSFAFCFVLFGCAFFVMLLFAAHVMRRAGAPVIPVAEPKAHAADEEESRVIQEVYQGLSRMEERIEALETILIDRAGSTYSRSEPPPYHPADWGHTVRKKGNRS